GVHVAWGRVALSTLPLTPTFTDAAPAGTIVDRETRCIDAPDPDALSVNTRPPAASRKSTVALGTTPATSIDHQNRTPATTGRSWKSAGQPPASPTITDRGDHAPVASRTGPPSVTYENDL